MRLRGHFDGQQVVLDQPAPPELKPNTPVEIVIAETREQVLHDLDDFLKALWARPIPATGQVAVRRWSREDLYERGGKPVS